MPEEIPSSKSGQKFVLFLIFLTTVLSVSYVLAHYFLRGTDVYATTEGTLRIEKTGEIILLDPWSIRWVVGEEKATPILNRMQRHNEQLRTLLARLNQSSDNLERRWKEVMGDDDRTTPSPLNRIDTAKIEGDWAEAGKALSEMAERYRSDELQDLVQELRSASDTLRELARIKKEQRNDTAALNPPVIEWLFWNSCHGIIFEVLFFALFGVLTNLLVNSAEYLRKGQFKEAEQWVAYTKLIYGPQLAVILVMAITVGWFDLGDYKTKANTMPLLGFILGYFSRRTVRLFDKLATRVLGQASQSIEQGPGKITQQRQDYQKKFESMMVPKALPEFRAQAQALAETIVKTEVLRQRGNS